LTSGEALPGKVNYLLGADPAGWHKDLATYSGVKYAGLYPGIDLRYVGTEGHLKGTYTLTPGADPSSIQWRYEGARGVTVDGAGDLQIVTADGVLTEQAPTAWQDLAGKQVPVDARYTVAPDGNIGFVLGRYDSARPLTIDPTLTYSTYLGGSNGDAATRVSVDNLGNIYIAGATSSSNFPLAGPYQPTYGGGGDVFVSKLNPTGSVLLYSTYLGGSNQDVGYGLDVDNLGAVYVSGFTNSTNFPLQNPMQSTYGGGLYDGFISKLDPTGASLTYSTYIGGSGQDQIVDMDVDAAGFAYVTGETYSTNFPTVNAYQSTFRGWADAFVSKLNAAGTNLLYSTYLGGNGGEGGYSIAVDGSGSAYISGVSSSFNFPLQNPVQASFGGGSGDSFLTKLNAAGTALLYSTYLGGSNEDAGYGVTVDAGGNAYHIGYTSSTNFPVQNAYQAVNRGGIDMFVSKFSAAGTNLVYSTYLGGSNDDGGPFLYGVAVDGAGSVYVAGGTLSIDFPLQDPIQAVYAGNRDAFLTKFSSAGTALAYSTYLGGNGNDFIYDVAVDAPGSAYITGVTASTNFPVANPYQPAYAGGGDAFIAKIIGPPTGTQTITPSVTATPTKTSTRTATSTPTNTATRTNTPTKTATPTSTACSITFSDVSSDHNFYANIRCLACRNIISGYSDGTFRPGNDITRGQIAKMVSNAAGFSEDPGPQIYEDVDATHTFYVWINRLSMRGHMGGYPCGLVPGEPCNPPENRPYFRPFANATRGQLAKIVSNAAGLNGTPTGIFYTDVQPDNPFYLWIMRLTEQGVMSGYECGGEGEPCDSENRPYFRPYNTVTRGQASKIVANTFFPGCQTPLRSRDQWDIGR
jgi:hypothetical protein